MKGAGGRPPKFDNEQRNQINQTALARLSDHGLPFSTWSPSKLADYLVTQGWSRTSLTRGCGCCCASRASPFPAIKTWKTSTDPDYEAKKNRVLELYAIADGKKAPGQGDPTVVMCFDEFGPLNRQPHPGRQWAPVAAGAGSQTQPRRRRRRATYKRPHGVRHLLAGYDLSTDRLRGTSDRSSAPAVAGDSLQLIGDGLLAALRDGERPLEAAVARVSLGRW